MKKYGLCKKDKLCSARAVELLFAPGGADFTLLAYPLRVVARRNDKRLSDAPVAFLISVPKRRLRHAVDRVAVRRRVREAFRLNRHQYPLPDGLRVDVAFVYVGNDVAAYAALERAVVRILDRLSSHYRHGFSAE